jgi:LL-diaminopimelate aminotransferase
VQQAGAYALDNAERLIPANVKELARRRDAGVEALRRSGFQLETPQATMYLWVSLPEGVASADFATRALEEEGVVVLPGSGFGPSGEGFFRIALTVVPHRLKEAVTRLGRCVNRLAGRGAGVV